MSQSKLARNYMEYAKGYPCLYGLNFGTAFQKQGIWTPVIKNGSTWHAANRKSGGITYSPKKSVYSYLIVLSKESFLTKNNLYNLDQEFIEFLNKRGLSDYYIDEGGGKEWYYDSLDYLALRLEFVQSKGIQVLEVLKEDPYPIRDLNDSEMKELEDEDYQIRKKKYELSEKDKINAEHFHKLEVFQQVYVNQIQALLSDPNRNAGLFVAPCGFGKTVVTSKAIRDMVNRVIIMVPTEHLKYGWKKALQRYGGFSKHEIHFIGGNKGVSRIEEIQEIMKGNKYALIACYASSPLLVDTINHNIQLGIYDEAHRLAGVAEINEDSEEKKQNIGRTKRLIRKARELGIKNLSLTFTPKSFTKYDESCEDIINSNDDVELFGEKIANISLREMINNSLLPPYKILFPNFNSPHNQLKAKVHLVLHEFMKQENNHYKMNHLILFGANHNDCKDIMKFLNELIPTDSNIKVVYLDQASTVKEGIREFESASRSILVNCQLLGEGVDIPIADSVSILSNRKSYTQLVQMLLRPGRFYYNKKEFYMIIALLEDDEPEFLEQVIIALTYIDPLLDQQIYRRLNPTKSGPIDPNDSSNENKDINEIIQSDSADWFDIPKIRQCIVEIVRKRSSVTTRLQFQATRNQCLRLGIKNLSSYNANKEQYNWPEKPWESRNMSIFAFLHEDNIETISLPFFQEVLKKENINSSDKYLNWIEKPSNFPSLEDINDGYFGSSYTNFQLLVPQIGRRR